MIIQAVGWYGLAFTQIGTLKEQRVAVWSEHVQCAGLIKMIRAGAIPHLAKLLPELAPPVLSGIQCPEDFGLTPTKIR